MKALLKLAIFILFMGLLGPSLHAELLIVKKSEIGFSPLDRSDDQNKAAVADILLKYEWPMVVANTSLTQEEQDELLTAGKPHAEELFIRKKLQEMDGNYDVIFIPTSLYELFVISQWRHLEKKVRQNIDLEALLNITNQSQKEVCEKIYSQYRNANTIFYPDAFFEVNNALVSELFTLFPMCKEYATAEQIFLEIKANSQQLAARWIHDKFIHSNEIDSLDPSALKAHGLLAKTIALEYQAREQNMGLLVRGTERIHQYRIDVSEWLMLPALEQTKKRSELMGSTIRYSNAPYSISFGNSLFAGFVRDPGACAYYYLARSGGYALFINKQDYIEHKLFNLFFIAPLAPLAALFAQGEYFHSRSKAAIPFSMRGKALLILGLTDNFIDPFGLLTTVRNPFLHAELFSNYLAKHMHTLSKGVNANLTDVEQKIYEEKMQQEQQQLRQAQEQAARYYKATRSAKKAALHRSRL